MSQYYAIDAIKEAIDKAIAFFKGPDLLKKWLLLAILLTIVSLLSGGGGGGGGGSGGGGGGCQGQQCMTQLNEFISQINQFISLHFETLLIIGLIIVLGSFIVGIILTLIKNMCLFSILESISLNNVRIIPYLKKFFSLALSLTIFEIILEIIWIPFSIAWLIVIFGIIILLFSSFLPTALAGLYVDYPILQQAAAFLTDPTILIGAAIIAFIGLIIFLIIGYIKDQFAFYIMYRENSKAWPAFLKGLGLARRNLMQVFVLILAQIGLAIVFGIIEMAIGLLVAIPLIFITLLLLIIVAILIQISALLIIPLVLLALVGALLLISYLFNVILAPIRVFSYLFNLSVLDRFLAGEKAVQKNQ